MEVEFKMRVTPNFEEISASVKKLQIASAIFNKRDKRRAKVYIKLCIKNSQNSIP